MTGKNVTKSPPELRGIFSFEKIVKKNFYKDFCINHFHLPLPSQKIGCLVMGSF